MDRWLAESVSGITLAKDEILPFCDCCALAKSHEQPRSRIASKRPSGPLQKFGSDIWGPVGVTSIGGFRYVFGMTDYYSAYGWVVFMKSKDEAPRALLLVNGLQERMWLTLSEMTVAMLLHAGLGREFWALAFCAAMHIRNNVYSRGVGSVPYRRHTGKNPDVTGLRVFGCPAYVHVDTGNRRKLDAKAFRGVFVAVSKLCRVMAKSEERHRQAAKRVLRYLKGTKTLGLTFSGGKADGLLHGYCDADWAGDVVSRRSTTGFVFMLCGAAVSWKSQLQATVALSTAEAEYMALCAAVCEALFLRELLRELCCAQSEATVIFEDNQSCIALTRNPMTHGRSKHIAIKYHFTLEKVLSGELISITVIIMPEGVSARAPRIPLPPVFSGQTKRWRRWRHQMEAYCNATGMKQAMMMSEHASSDQHFKLISDMYAVLQSGQQRTETAEAYYHRLDNAFLDLVAEAEEHEDVEAPSHNQVVTQFLAGLRPEYEPIIGILQVTAEHEGRAITWEGDCLKLAQNYSKRIEKNHASEPSAEGYIASGGTKRSAHLATGDGSGPRRLGAPLRGGCWQCGGPHFKRDCPQRPRGNRRQAAADPAPAAFVADEEEGYVAFMAENAGNTPPAKRVALSLLYDEWDDWAPEPGTLLYDLFGGEYESEEDVRPAEAAGAIAQANEREHDLDSHNMDEIISLSGLSDCFGMSDDEAGSASGGMGGSARVVTKSDSAYLLDAVALASVAVDARGACMLGLNDDLGSYPDMWVKDSGAYPHMVADSDSFVEYEQLAPPIEKFGADIWGPVGVTSIGGFRYVFGMTDYYSAYGWVVFMKSKDEAPRALLLVNGLQERMWLTLSEMTVAMLLHAGLGREFWALAFCAAMHIRNNVYSRGVGSVPYRRHTGKTPDVAGLRVFGCPAYVHVDAGNRRKLDAKAFRGVFVGYGQESHTYLVWNPATRRVVASRNVIFDEGWRDAASNSKGGSGGDAAASLEMFPQYQALLDISGVGSTSNASGVQEITEAHRRVVDETDDVEEELEIEEEPLTAEELELGPQRPTLELTQLETNEGTDDGGQEEPIVQRAERDPYPARSRRAPGQWWVVHPENPNDDAAAMMAAAFAAVTQGVDEPITLKQALSGPFKEQWAQAVESEFNSLEKQGTWVVCELPEERTSIPSKWVFKVKYNADGSIARFKARLVVQGCRQRHGIDYAETFAPTVKFTTIRVLFAIAVQYGWNIHQVDVDTAFLYAPVEEEIYMRPPPGYEQYDARGRSMVLRLLKSMYGLKQSPQNWHNTLHKFLVCYGFQQLKSDPGAYVYWQGGQLICILVVYVDDMIFKEAVWAADFKTALGARFDIKDLGVCAWALGMAGERDWDNATLKVHQAKYIDDMVHKFNLADAYAVSTPAEVGADVPGSNKPLAAEMPYQALVGSLLYAMVATRPDIAEAVSKLCRVMAKSEERHRQAAKRVLRYLKRTKTLGLTFSGGKADGLLHGYCDADWAGDVVSRRSTTGFVFMLCGAAVSWKSQLQATVALSTAEAEYMALCAAVCEALFLRELLRELCCAQSEATVIFEDNQSCIALTRNPMTHGRSKHIAIKYHFTLEKVLSGEVAIEYCPTAQMVADALTATSTATSTRTRVHLRQ
eukprot:jgi/Tetstr1/464380/TSEL_009173.t1